MVIGPIASPSRPSVRLTAFEAPTMTRVAKRIYPQPISGVTVLKNGRVISVEKLGVA